MRTLSVNNDLADSNYVAKVYTAIQENINYFRKFNGNWKEAAERAFAFAVEHRDDTYEDIVPYIKSLARSIMKGPITEMPTDIRDEGGEISKPFLGLRTAFDSDIDNFDGSDELMNAFKDLYLLDSDSFNMLKQIFKYDDASVFKKDKSLRITNAQLNSEFNTLLRKFGAEYTFKYLFLFFKNLNHYVVQRGAISIKELQLKPSNFSVLQKISDLATIVDENGRYYSIDKSSLLMHGAGVNPDCFKWTTIGNMNSDIIKIDIADLMNYIYEQVYVEQGVNTKHITWCDNRYKLTTPGGSIYLNLELDKFICVCRTEFILNFLASGTNSLIAVSQDTVYIKPARTFSANTLRVKFSDGHIIDLKIDVHRRRK